jgi:hypothetical protein
VLGFPKTCCVVLFCVEAELSGGNVSVLHGLHGTLVSYSPDRYDILKILLGPDPAGDFNWLSCDKYDR